MNIGEMHIDFDIKLQEVYSNAVDDFLPEEKDWLLNEAMYQFIKDRGHSTSNIYREGFEDTQRRYDDIESLIRVTEPSLPVIENGDYVSAFLPSNYLSLVDKEADVICGIVSTETVNVQVNRIKLFGNDNSDIIDYQLRLTEDGLPIYTFNKSDFTSDVIGVDAREFLQNLVVNKLMDIDPTIVVGWERVSNYRYPNQLVVVSLNRNIDLSITITYSKTTEVILDAVETSSKTATTGETTSVPCRLIDNEFLSTMLRNAFGTTKKQSPAITISNGIVRCYHNKKFNVAGLKLTYIKNPQLMDSRYGISCELGSTPGQRDEIARQIVDLAVANAAERISSSNREILRQQYLVTE